MLTGAGATIRLITDRAMIVACCPDRLGDCCSLREWRVPKDPVFLARQVDDLRTTFWVSGSSAMARVTRRDTHAV